MKMFIIINKKLWNIGMYRKIIKCILNFDDNNFWFLELSIVYIFFLYFVVFIFVGNIVFRGLNYIVSFYFFYVFDVSF